MKLIEFVRIFLKHIVLLVTVPLFLAFLVFYMTRNPDFKYASETTLYTGIATGSSVEMNKTFNYFVTNTAFDNFINIVKSRNTQQEVAIRLLSQHLLLPNPDPAYISTENFNELKLITPAYILDYIEKEPTPGNLEIQEIEAPVDSVKNTGYFISDLENMQEIPPSISKFAYEKTVKNLTELLLSSDTNFVYKLLNYPNPHYSYKDLSTIKVTRIGSSDLVQLRYETDDPGICRQTLALLTNACIRNYRDVKENRSDAIIKYFEDHLEAAAERLKVAEDKLLEFNKQNNIINYYEQSKAVAVVKEELDVEYNNKRIKLAGVEAAITRLEENLNNQEQIQLKSSNLVTLRNQLGSLNFKIHAAETFQQGQNTDTENLTKLKAEAVKLEEQLKQSVSELYSHGNSKEGIPIGTILTEWINNVIEAENLKAGIKVLGTRIIEFQKQYEIYAPAGAILKRIEREIGVSEREYLSILQGLNEANIKLQDNQLSSNIKAVDPPFFPLTPMPTKRKALVLMAAFAGLIIVLAIILFLEYFDDTLKNLQNASKILKLGSIGVIPKILLKNKGTNISFIVNRLTEIAIQNIELNLKTEKPGKTTKTLLFFSTLEKEGKSVIIGNLARKLQKQGEKVLVMNYSRDSLNQSGLEQTSSVGNSPDSSTRVPKNKKVRPPVLRIILGYPDTRIDYNSPFLTNQQELTGQQLYFEYNVNEKFYLAKNYKEILDNDGYLPTFIPDFVLIELPPILYYPYPVGLLSDIDLPILVCRSNRSWSSADQGVLDTLMELTVRKTYFILNGVELKAVESVLGDLPKKRSWARKAVKNIFRLQFASQNHI
jgi:polysaccharide biosynthesis transport protein